jgi:hypothetical protein
MDFTQVNVIALVLNIVVAAYNIMSSLSNRMADVKYIKEKTVSHSKDISDLYTKLDDQGQRVANLEGRLQPRNQNGQFVSLKKSPDCTKN